MADTTISQAAISNPTFRDLAVGTFAVFADHTYAATLSQSQVYLMLPIPDRVTILDGYVLSTHNTSYSFLAVAGFTDTKSLFITQATIPSSVKYPFDKGVPHTVTLTDSDSFPRMKPLCVTIHTAASGTLNGVLTVMALLQRS